MTPFPSQFIVVPAGLYPKLLRFYDKTKAHKEKIRFRGQTAWVLDTEAVRRSQRDLSLKEFGEPNPDDCWNLCEQASAILSKPIIERRDKSGIAMYQWKQKWIREELYRMKLVGMLWLASVTPSIITYRKFDKTNLWLNEGIGESEFSIAIPDENGFYHLLILQDGNKKLVIPLPYLEPNLATAEEHIILPSGWSPVIEDAQDVAMDLWRHIGVGIHAFLTCFSEESAVFPNDAVVEPIAGKEKLPVWLEKRLRKDKKKELEYGDDIDLADMDI